MILTPREQANMDWAEKILDKYAELDQKVATGDISQAEAERVFAEWFHENDPTTDREEIAPDETGDTSRDA